MSHLLQQLGAEPAEQDPRKNKAHYTLMETALILYYGGATDSLLSPQAIWQIEQRAIQKIRDAASNFPELAHD